MKAKLNIKRIIVLLSLALLFTPLIQGVFEPIKLDKLSGAYTLPDTVGLDWETWHNSDFQKKYTAFYEYKIGFRSLFVRLRNKLAYTAFDQSTSYVTIGKDKNLYTWGYLAAYKGLEHIKPKAIEDTVLYLDAMREALAERNMELVVVIAPNKVRVHPEILTDKHKNKEFKTTRYELFLKEFEKYPIHLIDGNAWFTNKRNDFEHPLFPSTGIHWSAYGAAQMADSLVKYFETITNKDMIDFNITGYEEHAQPNPSEVDLMKDLNLLTDFKPEGLRYPIVAYNPKDNETKHKPGVWTISDSFFWNLWSLNLQQKHFSPKSEFWFYNNTAYGNGVNNKPTIELDKKQRIDGKEIVLLMATEANLHQFPYGFISKYKDLFELDKRVQKRRVASRMEGLKVITSNKYNELFKLESIKKDDNALILSKCRKMAILENFQTQKDLEIQKYTEVINESEEWYNGAVAKGKEKGESPEVAISNNAKYMFYVNKRKSLIESYGKEYEQTINLYEEIIKNKDRVTKIKSESEEKKIPFLYNVVGHINYMIYINKQ